MPNTKSTPKRKASKGGSKTGKKARVGDIFRVQVALISKPDVDELTKFIGDSGTPLSIRWLYFKRGNTNANFRGIGFVDFATQAEANKFVGKHQQSYQGKKIIIKHAHIGWGNTGRTGNVSMRVKNVSADDEALLTELAGGDECVWSIRWLRNGCIIQFTTPEAADNFKRKDGKLLGDNKIKIKYEGRPTAVVSGFAKSMTEAKMKEFIGCKFSQMELNKNKKEAVITFHTITAMLKFIEEKGNSNYKGSTIKAGLVQTKQQRKQKK